MGSSRLDPENERKIVEMFTAGKQPTLREASRELGMSTYTISQVLNRKGIEYSRSHATASDREKNAVSDELHQAMLDVYRGCNLDVQLRIPGRPTRWLIMDDWHFPTCDREVVDAAFKAEPMVDGILTAEVMSLDAFSTFGPEHKTNTGVEFAATGDLLREAADHARLGVYVMRSNHVERILKWYKRQCVNAEQLGVQGRAFKHLMDDLKTSPKVKLCFNANGVLQVGTLIVGHGDKFMVTQGAAAQAEIEKLMSQPQAHGIVGEPELVVVNHEHRRFEGYARGRQCQLWTSPSACYFQRYALGSKPATYNRYPVVCGWSVVQLDKHGRLVPHESHTVHWKYAVLPPAVEAWRGLV